ncbi:MAG: hypothetical protein KDD58_03290 [Bdellovibrionales bacterium]|nr:hypothetical protein [Bdellovibrionales bacterium]
MKITLICYLFLLGFHAFAAKDFAIKAVAHANGALMANPPMPSLFSKKGKGEIIIRPAIFSASNVESRDHDPKIVDYSGAAGALMYNKQLTNQLGVFFLGMGSQLNGEFTSPGEVVSDPRYIIYANNVNSTSIQASAGFNFSLLKFDYFELQLFFAPSLTKTTVEQTIVQNDPTSPDDFDMSLNPVVATYVAGVQLGIKLSKYFVINPYFIISDLMSGTDRCQSYETTVRVHGNLFDLGDQDCYDGQNSSTSKIKYDTSFSAFGLNLLIPAWGLGLNAMAETGEIPFFGGVSMNMYYLTLSFEI